MSYYIIRAEHGSSYYEWIQETEKQACDMAGYLASHGFSRTTKAGRIHWVLPRNIKSIVIIPPK